MSVLTQKGWSSLWVWPLLLLSLLLIVNFVLSNKAAEHPVVHFKSLLTKKPANKVRCEEIAITAPTRGFLVNNDLKCTTGCSAALLERTKLTINSNDKSNNGHTHSVF